MLCAKRCETLMTANERESLLCWLCMPSWAFHQPNCHIRSPESRNIVLVNFSLTAFGPLPLKYGTRRSIYISAQKKVLFRECLECLSTMYKTPIYSLASQTGPAFLVLIKTLPSLCNCKVYAGSKIQANGALRGSFLELVPT